MRRALIAVLLGALAGAGAGAQTMDEIVSAAPASDWRALDPENTLYMELPAGRVIIELAPAFAPNHVANIKALAREGYFDGAAIVRAQDNYVVQWSRTNDPRPIRTGRETLPAEFDRAASRDLPFVRLRDPDTYARAVGFSHGFPSARGGGRAWLAHCYGMVGAGRDDDADSGGGAELYAVIGHSPRQLDRNVTLVGRVVRGMELLSTLPRGTGEIGFYETAAEYTPIAALRVAADLPESARVRLEALREDSASFAALLENRRNRRDAWYKSAAGRIGVCNAPLPVREAQ